MKAFDGVPRLDPECPARRHGTTAAFRAGCRCPHAREARRITHKRIREHRHQPQLVDAAGTIRRVQAMMAMGWTGEHLAARLGVNSRLVHHISAGRRIRVHAITAGQIKALCDELGMQEGPSKVGRRVARKKGWVTVLAWDDIDNPAEAPDSGPAGAAAADAVAVKRALDGEVRFTALSDVDRSAVVAELRRMGLDTSAIAHRFRTNRAVITRVDEFGQDAVRLPASSSGPGT